MQLFNHRTCLLIMMKQDFGQRPLFYNYFLAQKSSAKIIFLERPFQKALSDGTIYRFSSRSPLQRDRVAKCKESRCT